MNNTEPLHEALGRLLAHGAVLDVTNPDEPATTSWPLARHHRLDGDVVWIRPLHPGHRHPNGTITFPLGDCLRRGIAADSFDVDVDRIRFNLASGQTLEVRPALHQGELDALELWDTFTLTVLTAAEEADLDRLDADSWHGRFL